MAPLLQHARGAGGTDLAAHALAGQQPEGGGDGELLAPCHAVVAFGLAFLGQAGAQVGGDPLHVPCAYHFDAGLFERVVHLPRLARGRHARFVHRVVVIAQAQGQTVGRTAQPGHFGRRQGARGQRQAGAPAGQAGGSGLEGHGDIGRIARDGAQGAGGGALELLGAGVLGGAAHFTLTPALSLREREQACPLTPPGAPDCWWGVRRSCNAGNIRRRCCARPRRIC